MTSPFDCATFLLVWIGFLVLMSSGLVIFFIWGIRNKQFSDQDRARYLPLQSGIPAGDDEDKRKQDEGRPQP